jgi:hypothetical protein
MCTVVQIPPIKCTAADESELALHAAFNNNWRLDASVYRLCRWHPDFKEFRAEMMRIGWMANANNPDARPNGGTLADRDSAAQRVIQALTALMQKYSVLQAKRPVNDDTALRQIVAQIASADSSAVSKACIAHPASASPAKSIRATITARDDTVCFFNLLPATAAVVRYMLSFSHLQHVQRSATDTVASERDASVFRVLCKQDI